MPATAARAPCCSTAQPVCACLTPVGQAAGRAITTVEGLANGALSRLQRSFHHSWRGPVRHLHAGHAAGGNLADRAGGAARARRRPRMRWAACSAAAPAIARSSPPLSRRIASLPSRPSRSATGSSARGSPGSTASPGVDGSERFGDDVAPADALWLTVVRSPHASATFTIGDLAPLFARYPGLVRVLTAADVPGDNAFGVIARLPRPAGVRRRPGALRGEAIAAVVGDAATIERFDPERLSRSPGSRCRR